MQQIELQTRHFESWSTNDNTEIVQRTVQNENSCKTKVNITNQDLNLNIETNWIKYPFTGNHTLVDLILIKAPVLKQIRSFLPLVETTMNYRNRTLMCSSCVLKDGKKIKKYLPLEYTKGQYSLMRRTNSAFDLPYQGRLIRIFPNDVVEIIEE